MAWAQAWDASAALWDPCPRASSCPWNLRLGPAGADVWLTDVKEVLPLLKANYEQNISPAACRGASTPPAQLCGPAARGWVQLQAGRMTPPASQASACLCRKGVPWRPPCHGRCLIPRSAACDGGRDLANAVGRVTVAELDWVNEDHRSAVKGPFDFILAGVCGAA